MWSGRPGVTSYPLRQKTEQSRCFSPLPNKLVTSCPLPARLVCTGPGLALFSLITKQAEMPRYSSRDGGGGASCEVNKDLNTKYHDVNIYPLDEGVSLLSL